MLVRLHCTDNMTGEEETHDFEIPTLDGEGVAQGFKEYLEKLSGTDDWDVRTLAFVTNQNGCAVILAETQGDSDEVLVSGILYTSFYRKMY